MTAAAATPPIGARFTGYRPWLDGVRAIAILLVLARHLGLGWASHAGGPGVALFFALSGYLITGLLLDEHRRGGVSLTNFYVRRAVRLLPALLVMLLVTDIWFAATGRGAPVTESLSVLFYVKNYRDVIAGDPGVFGQAWSLAVEEHFYLLWPALLLAMTARWRRRKVVTVTLALAAAALLWRSAVVVVAGTGRWPYVGTFERADSLLIGCALAVAVRAGVRIPLSVSVLALAVYGWIVSPLWHPQTVEQTIGYTVEALACALLVAGLDSTDSPVRRVLSTRPLVTIGLLSYGVYLWHIPVLLVMPMADGWVRDLAVAAASFALAAASYWALEQPLRRWAQRINGYGSRAFERARYLHDPVDVRGARVHVGRNVETHLIPNLLARRDLVDVGAVQAE